MDLLASAAGSVPDAVMATDSRQHCRAAVVGRRTHHHANRTGSPNDVPVAALKADARDGAPTFMAGRDQRIAGS